MTMKVFSLTLLVLLFVTAGAFAQSPSPADNNGIAAQEIRNETRLDEERAGGFSWESWPIADPSMIDAVKKREPRFDVYFADADTVDFALADVDHNGKPDLVVYFWGSCGSHGCPVNVYFDMPRKQVGYYYGWTVRPYQKGVMLDDNYYQL